MKYLGIISFASPTRPIAPLAQEQLEKTQDLVREKGGLGLLLGMCQIDGTNPSKQPTYFSSLLFELDEGELMRIVGRECVALREHALFAIRNLTRGNLKNQDYM